MLKLMKNAYRILRRTAATQPAMLVLFFVASPLAAQTPLLDVFSACEASVMDGSDNPLQEIGTFIDETERGSRIRVDTPDGTVLAMFLPPTRQVSACLLWGRQLDLAVEFQDHWLDWVEWEEAATASEIWFENALETPGSVDLTDHSQSGYVVARCNSLENGLVLSSQPIISNAMRQILPDPSHEREPVIHYQFSVVTALPGRCSSAVETHKAQSTKHKAQSTKHKTKKRLSHTESSH
jgi:hypothetical protein